jgi:hypothetical protein
MVVADASEEEPMQPVGDKAHGEHCGGHDGAWLVGNCRLGSAVRWGKVCKAVVSQTLDPSSQVSMIVWIYLNILFSRL